MGFSISKILKRDNNDDQTNSVKSEEQANVENKSAEQAETKKKHGEPGVCCGSCS